MIQERTALEKEINGFPVEIRLLYRLESEVRENQRNAGEQPSGEQAVGDWQILKVMASEIDRKTAEDVKAAGWTAENVEVWQAQAGKLKAELLLKESFFGLEYELRLQSEMPAQLRLELELKENNGDMTAGELFHLIPANIFGDNNLAKAQPGEYPMLTWEHEEDAFCSPFWEFRADRASQPVAMLCCQKGAVGISVEPYTETQTGFVRNGLRAELPNKIAVSLGYTNDPVTFVNKREYWPSTRNTLTQGTVQGRIYGVKGQGRLAAHKIIEEEYNRTRELPSYRKSLEQAGRGLMEQFVETNWSEYYQNYTNMECHLPQEPQLKAWRQLAEIGWTGGGILAYTFSLAKEVLHLPENYFAGRLSPSQIVEEILKGYQETSGFLNDVTREDWRKDGSFSPVNGWWSGFHLAENCHCAYTNGSAVYYILKLLCTCTEQKPEWKDTVLKVLDTVMELQREDGNYGNTYACDKKAVLDCDGFAGCWFAAAMPYAYRLTGDKRYLESAKRALGYYVTFVRELNCYGTPMDTWKSVDQEGNLAFIRAARQMHELTGEQIYLDDLELGARYQYLWQYGFRARPEFAPLKDSGWNSCGGSITSVSNPHIHPMGMLILDDLYYLAKQTGKEYHEKRAKDGLNWLMNTLELYPEITGYGSYGVMTERYCPSDGLVIETYGNGEHASMWFTYNGWAAANALEAVLTELRRRNHCAENFGENASY